MGEFKDLLPLPGLLPDLTEQEIARYVALGDAAKSLLRSGEPDRAEAAYKAQIALFPPNPDPYVELALLAAGRGRDTQAIEFLRAAMARGFTDLPRIERAETGKHLAKSMAFLRLTDAVPRLAELEGAFGGFSSYRAAGAPVDAASVERDRAVAAERIERMAPVLGPRLSRLWTRTADGVTAALLEAYVTQRKDADDLPAALDRLMSLYAGGTLLRWESLSDDDARRLGKVAATALEKFPRSSMRAGALTCSALARYGERDRKGALTPAAADAIRSSLNEVLTSAPDSPFAATALEGLVHVELETGRPEVAAERYRAFRQGHAADASLLAGVRDALGTLALRAGGLPEFTATALDGSAVDRHSLGGKVTVVDFWATWCRPCVDEFPTIRRIAARHGGDVAVVGFSLDSAADIEPDALRAWVAAQKLPGRQIRDGSSWDSEIVRAFGVKEIPFTLVVAADGSVLAVDEHGKALERAVAAAIGK